MPKFSPDFAVIGLLALCNLLAHLDRTILSLFVDPIKDQIGVSDFQMSLILGPLFGVVYGVAVFPLGRLADVSNRRNLIAGAVALWSSCTAASGIAGSFISQAISRVGLAVGEAAIVPGAFSLLGDFVEKEKFGRALSVFSMGGTAGVGAAMVASGAVAGMLGKQGIALPVIGLLAPWQFIFIAMGLTGIAIATVFVMFVREPARITSKGATNLSSLASHLWAERAFYLPVLAAHSSFCILGAGFFAWAPTYFMRTYGLTVSTIGPLLGTTFVFCVVLGSIATGVLNDKLFLRFGGHAPVLLLRAAFALMIPAPFFAFGSESLILSLAGTGYIAFFQASLAALTSIAVLTKCPGQMRGQLGSIIVLCSSIIGFGLGPVIVALLGQFQFGEQGLGPAIATHIVTFAALGLLLSLVARFEGSFGAARLSTMKNS